MPINIAKQIEELERECIILEEEILNLDTQQNIYKLQLNSIYGVFAQKYSPLFDIDHSASITLSGQATIKQSADLVYDLAKEKGFDGKKEELYIGGDTDSLYITIEPLIKLSNITLLKDGKITDEAKILIKEIDTYLNNKICEWARKELNSADPKLVFKRETINDVALFLRKKRYILHIIDKEGFAPKKPFKYVGVEIAKSTISKEVKEYLKKIVENIMMVHDRKLSNEIYKQAYEEFKKLSVAEVSLRSKISDLEKQEAKIEDGKIGKGTPKHAKAAIHYNSLLKHCKLDHKYETIGSGIKIKYFDTTKNSFNYKVMAFLDEYPEELRKIVDVNYDIMFDKTVVPLIKTIYNCIGWNLPSMSAEAQTDLFDLFS